ncbi:acid-sensing ion channel 2-like [Clytia hemisphaerica]|uniref:Uncharacterized protein n=1 Tax=Clytia hemisphaerica TaxID=252671 RepID=A0A7M5WLV2_9CNID
MSSWQKKRDSSSVLENMMDERNGNANSYYTTMAQKEKHLSVSTNDSYSNYIDINHNQRSSIIDGKKNSSEYQTLMVKVPSDEDDRWHEMMASRKLFLKNKINEYANTFTMHGLSRIIVGKNIESLFWFMMLFGGLVTCFVVIHGLVSKFYRYEIYTEIRSIIAHENYFPAITFCEDQLFVDNYFAYCGVSQREGHKNLSKDHECHRMGLNYRGNISYKANKYWSNGLFNVTRCRTWGGINCINSGYLRTMYHFNHSCFQWNYQGNLSDVYSHAEILMDFHPPPWLGKEEKIIALPQDPQVHEVDTTKKVELEPYKAYEIKLDKTLVKRLSTPFPSNCTYDKGEDIFPGRYTRRNCIESHNFLEIYKACGQITDYVDQFIPQEFREKYGRNDTSVEEARTCIFSQGSQGTKKTNECNFPCTDYDLSVIHSFNERKDPRIKAKYQINIQYQKVDTYQTMEEKELYPWDQMLSEMGGLIGLIIGASVISVVEVFVYFFLVFWKKLCF